MSPIKRFKKLILRRVLLECVLIGLMVLLFTGIIPDIVLAQDVPPPMLPGGPNQTPVDGGLLALGAAGAGYAVKKFRENRTKRAENPKERRH